LLRRVPPSKKRLRRFAPAKPANLQSKKIQRAVSGEKNRWKSRGTQKSGEN
jgi:hypothetical protein